MESNIINALEDLRVSPSHLQAKNGGDPHPHPQLLPPILSDWTNYSTLISWVATELKILCSEVDEAVTPINTSSSCSDDDLSSFKMELSSLLKELGCPYATLMDPPLAERFEDVTNRQILLNFLLSELQAARIIHVLKKNKDSHHAKGSVSLKESPTAQILRETCQELDLGKPPEGMSAEVVWAGILPKVKARASGSSPSLEPLFTGVLTADQWTALDNYFKELQSDYGMRREMLLKRLDVTVQSFHWSDRLRGDKDEKLRMVYGNLRPKMVEAPGVGLADVLAARSDLAVVEKTSSTSVRKNTRSAVNDVVIGKVPDRGGRPNEVEPPPPEMPSWQQRQAPGSSGWIQRGGGGGGRGRGGNSDHRGGGSHHQGDHRGGGGGGYRGGNDNRGGSYQHQGDYRGGGGGFHQGSDNRSYNQHDDRGGGGSFQGDYRGDNNQGGGGGYYQQGGDNRGGQFNQGSRGRGRGGGGNYYQGGRGGGRVQGGWST